VRGAGKPRGLPPRSPARGRLRAAPHPRPRRQLRDLLTSVRTGG